MKKGIGILVFAALTVTLTGCTSAYYASSGAAADDLYAVHSRTEIARRQQAEAEARKAEAEARRAEIEALIAEADANAAAASYKNGSSGNSSASVLADNYESAYARRLRGFNSASYRMPSSYINARYSPTFTYVSAYDPAFYNVMIMGDEVWVEPKYVTAMFGTWGLPSYHSAWYYNSWWSPSFSIGFGGWGWNVGLSWYDPWWGVSPWHYNWAWSHGYGWGWGPRWNWGWGWGGPHYAHGRPMGGGYRPGGPGGPGIVHRPTAPRGTNVYNGNSGGQINRAPSGNRSGVYQGGTQNRNSQNRGTTTRSNNASNGSNSGYNSNNTQRRSSTSGSGFGSQNSGTRSGGYTGGSGGYSGGSSGGNSRGGYSGSSSRGR